MVAFVVLGKGLIVNAGHGPLPQRQAVAAIINELDVATPW